MKIEIRKTLFTMFVLFSLFGGIVNEALTWVCLLLSIWINRRAVVALIGKRSYFSLLLVIVAYCTLFIIQLSHGSVEPNQVIRLYGMTKCIITPILIALAFMDLCRQKYVLNVLIFIVIVFNMLYISSILLLSVDLDDISFQLGSINGGSSTALVLLPAVVFNARRRRRQSQGSIIFKWIYYLSTIVFVAICDSGTSFVILALQILLYVITLIKNKLMLKTIRRIAILAVAGLIVFSIMIATGKIPLDPTELRSRADIWYTGYLQFAAHDRFSLFFGTGNDVVQMLSKQLEAHNAFLEVLFIYGYIGLAVFIIFVFCSVRKCISLSKGKSLGLYTSLISYVIIISMHPFYTGLFVFQVICVIAIIYSVFVIDDAGGIRVGVYS